MNVPALPKNSDDRRLGLNQGLEVGVFIGGILGVVGASKGGQLGVLQGLLFHLLEKFHILGVGTGPASLNIIDPQIVQLFGNTNLVHHREIEILGLGPVP